MNLFIGALVLGCSLATLIVRNISKEEETGYSNSNYKE